MLSNSTLLFEQVVANPSDETLLSAYSDSLEEDGRLVRARLVRDLLGATRRYRIAYPPSDGELETHIFRLQRRLLIRPIQTGDFLIVDEEGEYYPAITREDYNYIVARVERVNPDGSLILMMRLPDGHMGQIRTVTK